MWSFRSIRLTGSAPFNHFLKLCLQHCTKTVLTYWAAAQDLQTSQSLTPALTILFTVFYTINVGTKLLHTFRPFSFTCLLLLICSSPNWRSRFDKTTIFTRHFTSALNLSADDFEFDNPQPLPKRLLQTMRCSACSFNLQYPLVSFRSSSSCLRLIPRLPVTYTLPYIFPSTTCFRRQFLCKMWPIQLAFLPFNVCRIFRSSSILCNASSFFTRSAQLIPSVLLEHLISEL